MNVSVVEAARRVGRGHATMIGLGGAVADTIHSGLAFAGLAPLVAAHPAVMRGLALASAAIVIGYAIAIWVRRSETRQPARTRGFATGLLLTLPNPAALLAWIAVASALLPDATIAVGITGALGVGVGSAAWFAWLARIAARAQPPPVVASWLPRIVAIAFMGISVIAVVRVW